MDIWQKMYEKAQALYQPQEVSDFVYAKYNKPLTNCFRILISIHKIN